MARFFDDDAFDEGFEQELVGALEVESSLRAKAPDFATCVFDVTFVSDDKKKLAALAKLLTGLGYRMQTPVRRETWECSGKSMPLPVTEHSVAGWVIDMYQRGYEHDCKLEAYGASSDFTESDLARSGEQIFGEALAAFERGNRGLSIALFSMALAVEPDNPNTWYSRACVKDQIDLDGSAREDYDKAIELAPRFGAALVNRGANKDNAGEYDAAIADYDAAIAINANDVAAFLNRGNSKFNKGDKAGAIADWKVAAGLGSAVAKKRLASHA